MSQGSGHLKYLDFIMISDKIKLFEHFALVKNVQLDKNMAGGRRDRGCSDFQSRYRRIA